MTVASGKVRWRRRKDARPQELLDAALHSFVTHGFAATRLEDIAHRAGVSKGTIYLYFASKEDIFKAIVESVFDDKLSDVDGMIAQFTGPARDLLRLFLTFMGKAAAEPPMMHLPRLIIGEAGNFPALTGFYHQHVVTQGLARITGILERGMARGEFRSLPVRQVARLVIAPLLLMTVYRSIFERYDAQPFDPDSYVETHLAIFMRGIEAEGAP